VADIIASQLKDESITRQKKIEYLNNVPLRLGANVAEAASSSARRNQQQ
jgi:hypothetical protein